jgi:hypothetical protein
MTTNNIKVDAIRVNKRVVATLSWWRECGLSDLQMVNKCDDAIAVKQMVLETLPECPYTDEKTKERELQDASETIAVMKAIRRELYY